MLLVVLVWHILASDHATQSNNRENRETTRQSEQVIIALLDTGVSTTAITTDHLLAGYNYVLDTDDTEDLLNHGTAVASVILGCESAGISGIAQDAYIVPLVVATKQEGEMLGVSPTVLAQAIRDSVDVYGADIINISLGIRKNDSELLQAVVYAEEKDVLVVSAVGNGGEQGETYYPAAYDTVLSVGSCDEHGQKSEFSQNGSDVLALGEDIWLASKNGKTYGARGTSYATGYVTAAAANLLAQEPTLSAGALREKIIENAAGYGGCLP